MICGRLCVVKVENADHVILSPQMIDLQIPDSFVSIGLEKIEWANIDAG